MCEKSLGMNGDCSGGKAEFDRAIAAQGECRGMHRSISPHLAFQSLALCPLDKLSGNQYLQGD